MSGIRVIRTCEVCGQKFEARSAVRSICSDKCYQKRKYERKRGLKDKAFTIEPTITTSALFSFEEGGLKTVKAKFSISAALPVIECETKINVEPRNAANIFEVIDKPASFQPNTTYRAQYKGSEKNVEVRAIGLNHNSKLPFIEFNTWSYNKSTKTITFLVNHHLNLDFDYTMLIFYTVNGVGVEDPAELVISNIRDHI